MKVKDLIKELQELDPEEQEREIVFRQYDRSESDYYYTKVSESYCELVTTTSHPMYDYYEFMPESLRNDPEDEVEEVIVIE